MVMSREAIRRGRRRGKTRSTEVAPNRLRVSHQPTLSHLCWAGLGTFLWQQDCIVANGGATRIGTPELQCSWKAIVFF